MIIDSHVYCFEPADSPAGYASGEEHLKWVQASQAYHHQPAFRIRDRAPGPSDILDPDGRSDIANLPDLNFRINHARGRVVWEWQGEEYTKHFYPPNLRSCEFTAMSLNGEMDYADVDVALIHTNPMMGRGEGYVAYLSSCVERFPKRLRCMAPVDEYRVLTETDAVVAELDRAISHHGLHAVKFCPPLAYMAGDTPWDDGPFRPFWEAVVAHRVPVFFTLGSGPSEFRKAPESEQRRGYLEEQRLLMRWMERYPDAVCSITHGFPYRIFLEGKRLVLPDEVWEPFRDKNCNMEVCFPVRLGDVFDFPYREVWPVLESMVEHIGADHLLWGTDMPFQNRFCTYRQSRDWIERTCNFLSQDDLNLLMGGTAQRVLDL